VYVPVRLPEVCRLHYSSLPSCLKQSSVRACFMHSSFILVTCKSQTISLVVYAHREWVNLCDAFISSRVTLTKEIRSNQIGGGRHAYVVAAPARPWKQTALTRCFAGRFRAATATPSLAARTRTLALPAPASGLCRNESPISGENLECFSTRLLLLALSPLSLDSNGR